MLICDSLTFLKCSFLLGAYHSCALTKKLHQDMRSLQQSAIVDDDYILTENNFNNMTILDLEFERMHNSFNQRSCRGFSIHLVF